MKNKALYLDVYNIEHENIALRREQHRQSENRIAAIHAREVLRSGGNLLHVHWLTGVESITIDEVANGKPYLSIWENNGQGAFLPTKAVR